MQIKTMNMQALLVQVDGMVKVSITLSPSQIHYWSFFVRDLVPFHFFQMFIVDILFFLTDPDMLEVGNGKMTTEEYVSHEGN